MKTSRLPKGPRLRIEITEEMIVRGVRRDSRHCMIAEGVGAAFPGATHISVDLATIRLTDPSRGIRLTYLTPRVAQMHLVAFDKGEQILPIGFQLRNPQVTRSGSTKAKKHLAASESQKANGRHLNDVLKTTNLRRPHAGTVSERIGGQTPPLQTDASKVPFTRRRAYGLRALEL